MEKEIPDAILATAHALLKDKGLADTAQIVYENDNPTRKKKDYDSWNNIQIWDVYFYVSPRDYNWLESRLEEIENQISNHLNIALDADAEDAYSVTIKPRKIQSKDWRADISELSTETRKSIADKLCQLEGISWSGQLDHTEFLSRLYDLQALPSHDSRYTNAFDDIWQHCVCHLDWDDDWIFNDNRFNLTNGPTDAFLRFLCQTVNSETRPDYKQAKTLVAYYNEKLRPEGWEIIEDRNKHLHVFAYRKLDPQEKLAAYTRSRLESLDADYISEKIKEMELAINDTPHRAIGEAKELIESCSKVILIKKGSNPDDLEKMELPNLVGLLTKELELTKKGTSNEKKGAEIIKKTLGNLSQISNNLAELRNLYGSGHGKDGQHKGLQPRHARLAVTSAIGFVNFMIDTYYQREDAKEMKISA